MPAMSTCDLCDLHKAADPEQCRVLPVVFNSYGARPAFSGLIHTVKCYEDNEVVKAMLSSPGDGRVLVVDGAASLNRALIGGNIAAEAARNRWAGVVVYGAVRDRAELRAADIGLFALGHVPMPTVRLGQGLHDVVLSIAGVVVRPGEMLVADEDGVVIMPAAVS